MQRLADSGHSDELAPPAVSRFYFDYCDMQSDVPPPLRRISAHRKAIMMRGGKTPAVIDIGLFDAQVGRRRRLARR